jgi:hypothetical protein
MNHPAPRSEAAGTTQAENKKAAPRTGTTAKPPQGQGKANASNDCLQSETTLGWSLFRDPLYASFGISDIRQRLELKFAACCSLDGVGAHPIDHHRIRNPFLASLAGAGRILRGWNVSDLTQCHGMLEIPAETVLVATLECPIWGEDDVILLGLIEQIEAFQLRAERSGRTL